MLCRLAEDGGDSGGLSREEFLLPVNPLYTALSVVSEISLASDRLLAPRPGSRGEPSADSSGASDGESDREE